MRRNNTGKNDVAFLRWDTDFFRSRIGKFDCASVKGKNDVLCLEKSARKKRIKYLVGFVPCDKYAVRAVLKKQGFVPIKTVADLALDLRKKKKTYEAAGDIKISPAENRDMPALKNIAGNEFSHDRFHSDPFFTGEQADRYHRIWIENLFRGLADVILVAKVKNNAAGFVACKITKKDPASCNIRLIAVKRKFQGKGIGRVLINACSKWAAGKCLKRIEVRTELSNKAALSLYGRAGFKILKKGVYFRKIF